MFPIREGKELVPLGMILKRSAEETPDQLALKKEDVELTYGELDRISSELALGLLAKGLRPHERIALIGGNSPQWCLIYFAILKAGMTVVPIDPLLSLSDIHHIITDAKAKVVFADPKWYDEIAELKIARTVGFEMIDDLRRGEGDLPEVDLDSLAILIYTSGTTGFSKGVMLSHRNVVNNVDSLYRSIDYDKNDRFLSLLPLHHTFAATCGLLTAIYNQAQIFFPRSLKSKDIITALRNYQITVLLVVPLILEKFVEGFKRKLRHAGVSKRIIFGFCSSITKLLPQTRGFLFKGVREGLGMSHIRYIISGGAALPRWVARQIESLGLPLIQGYGLTEASPVVTVNPPDRPKNESVGLPIPGVKVRIVDPNPDGVGEIIVQGENVMEGYYNNDEATREAIKHGWLYTGDLGYFDDDGYLYIVGRKKYIIVTPGGKNVYPEAIEAKLLQSDYIKEALVIPERSEGKEEVVAIIYPDFEKLEENFKDLNRERVEEIIRNEIIKHGAEIPEYGRIRRFTIRDEEFPKTTTRKIKRHLFLGKRIEV
ncbi:long-chain fatty acid--CoA ligase [candidate division WOR-3 bacterium]|uniref:Long-chain fatty acid--CoA ligase n=1 Tax=candidate division WOR-3 bacterium TaxID=2052148 RepID=A0A660SFT6_UNCW3|nr:MAG: long-chain fatty acid--CoA ligase [candidate division WOR-3 bacterium]